MKHKLKPKRFITKLVETPEDWYPPIENKYVKVTFWPHDGRLTVWGDDDFGMEIDRATRKQFEDLCSSSITKERCKKLGMILA